MNIQIMGHHVAKVAMMLVMRARSCKSATQNTPKGSKRAIKSPSSELLPIPIFKALATIRSNHEAAVRSTLTRPEIEVAFTK